MATKKAVPVSILLPILDKPVQARQSQLCGQIKATLEALKPGQSFDLPKENTERVRAQFKILKKSGSKATFGLRTEGKTIHVGRTA